MKTKDYTVVKEQWDKVLDNISKKVSKPHYDAFIKPTFPVSSEENVLMISTPSSFAKDYLDHRYKQLFRDTINEVSESDFEINFVIQEQQPVETVSEEVKEDPEKSKKKIAAQAVQVNNNYNALNTKYTFDNFVIGNHNRFACAAAQRVAESPGQAYNPLFIYGGVGLGKTHLMHAIGNQMVKNFKTTKIAYLSSERFTNDLINSIKDDKMIEFRNKYRSIDLLLIDDIQFIEGKERTQEEFFHTFNALYDEGKQIILSSDRLPKEISMLEDRLRSRFEMGLLTDIQPPDFETRIAILKKKCEVENINVSDDVLHYIASAFKDNVRELEGAFIRVMAYASLTNIPTSVNLARTILGREPSKEITIENIQNAVAEFYGIEPDDLRGNKKTKEITWARHVAMYICRDLTKFSLQKISSSFGRKDHTTVIHAFDKVKNLVQNVPETNSEIQKLIDTLE